MTKKWSLRGLIFKAAAIFHKKYVVTTIKHLINPYDIKPDCEYADWPNLMAIKGI